MNNQDIYSKTTTEAAVNIQRLDSQMENGRGAA